jgi:hypothetical protein
MEPSKRLMTRYLLGELSEDEQTAFEESYFRDPSAFAEVETLETALVDEYVRGQLSPSVRNRFEQVYLTDPRRRERVRFAEALISRVDRDASVNETTAATVPSGLSAWLMTLAGPRLATAAAFACLLLVAGSAWFVLNARRQEAARIEAARIEEQRRDQEAAREAAARPPQQPPNLDAPRLVALALVVGPGQRTIETAAPTLTIPPATEQVHLNLTLRESGYARYRVVLRALGGAEVVRRGDLTPAAQGPHFSIIVPAAQLRPGNYMLTLQGANRGSDYEDLSQSLFRVAATPATGPPR